MAGTAIDAGYVSQWHSFEVNAGHEFCQRRLAVLAGFRYAEIDESWGFGWSLVGTMPSLSFDTATRNRLYGFQFGGQALLWDRGGPLSIEGLRQGRNLRQLSGPGQPLHQRRDRSACGRHS